jgi:2'-phosphotransferase
MQERGRLFIRALSGHSASATVDLGLRLVQIDTASPILVHGTYFRHWNGVRSHGLSGRPSGSAVLGFVSHEPPPGTKIKGLERMQEILVYVDMQKAMDDGTRFFKTQSGDIVCAGNKDGCVRGGACVC